MLRWAFMRPWNAQNRLETPRLATLVVIALAGGLAGSGCDDAGDAAAIVSGTTPDAGMAVWPGPGAGQDAPDVSAPTPPDADAGVETPTPTPATDAGVAPNPEPSATATIRLEPLDIWARPLAAGGWHTAPDGTRVALTGTMVELVGLGPHRIELEAEGHRPAAVRVDLEPGPTGPTAALRHEPDARHGAAFDGETLFVGLAHRYFASTGRPPREGNVAELLMDGESAWARAYERIAAAQETVHVATWWWESGFAMVRPAMAPPEDPRYESLNLMDRIPATVRVLVWHNALLEIFNTDSALRERADAPGDGFEVMGHANTSSGAWRWSMPVVNFGYRLRQARPELSADLQVRDVDVGVADREVDTAAYPTGIEVAIGSWHQKFLVLDDREAFVGA